MLDGIRIVEIEGVGPGPFAGMMLADLGAEVIVVHRENPPAPAWPERPLIDRGKQSIVLDLKNPKHLESVHQLLATADGLIEGFRPGVMERLGLGPTDVLAANPALVYGRMTGWGQEGPLASQVGHDLNYIGLSGALYYASDAGTPPFTPPTLVGDIGGGALYLVAGMLAALLNARSTGRGRVVDAAIVDGSAHMMNLLMSLRAANTWRDERGHSLLDGPPWSRCYRTADGAWLSVQCLEPRFYDAFIERLALADDPAYRQDPDPASWPELTQQFTQRFASEPMEHWLMVFADSEACVAPVLTPVEAQHHEHMRARGTWLEKDGQLQARSAPRFDGKVPDDPPPAPRRGEHTESILARLAANK